MCEVDGCVVVVEVLLEVKYVDVVEGVIEEDKLLFTLG